MQFNIYWTAYLCRIESAAESSLRSFLTLFYWTDRLFCFWLLLLRFWSTRTHSIMVQNGIKVWQTSACHSSRSRSPSVLKGKSYNLYNLEITSHNHGNLMWCCSVGRSKKWRPFQTFDSCQLGEFQKSIWRKILFASPKEINTQTVMTSGSALGSLPWLSWCQEYLAVLRNCNKSITFQIGACWVLCKTLWCILLN